MPPHRMLVRYNRWANHRLYGALAVLPESEVHVEWRGEKKRPGATAQAKSQPQGTFTKKAAVS